MFNIAEYLTETLGEPVHLIPEPEEEVRKLPFYLSNSYNLWKGDLFHKPVIFIENKEKELLTPDQLKKQIDNFSEILGAPVILLLGGIESYKRNRLIQKRINFIMANRQIYLPDFLIDLKDYLKHESARKGHLTPPAQFLLLYHLQKESLDRTTYRQLTTKVPYEYLTVSRAVENLVRFGLCNTEGAKEKLLRFGDNRHEIWENALPFLSSPVKKTIYINENIPSYLVKLTGINALAHYTNIGGAPLDQFAISERNFHKLHRQGLISMYSEYDGRHEVQLWKYNPICEDTDEFVDRLSLYLIFRYEQNERIQIELENMIKKILW
ncbi:MAG: hypothetical protein FJY10_05360 [Bacteroidetes bacterium]|nr:hypothetical protein [Bacteroidota bacterium]